MLDVPVTNTSLGIPTKFAQRYDFFEMQQIISNKYYFFKGSSDISSPDFINAPPKLRLAVS